MHPTCTQKTIREEVLEKQVADILGSIEIPESFHQWAINCLKEESNKDQDDRHSIIQGHQDNLSLCNRKLETVVSMRINQELEAEEFKQRKNELMDEKARLMELLTDAQNRVNTWVDHADTLFNFAKTAKSRFEKGTIEEKKAILQALGSNHILKDRLLRVDLNKPLTLVKSMAPEAKAIEASLEPLFSENHTENQAKISEEFAKNEIWWR